MSRTPAVNPNVHDIADRAKHAYAEGTQLLAATHYRLAELAGTGRLDPDASISLQEDLVGIWVSLGAGTVDAVRNMDALPSTWEEDVNTYSDGRKVMTQVRIEPREVSSGWQHNRFLVGGGAVLAHPQGTICCISHPGPVDDQVAVDAPSWQGPLGRVARAWVVLGSEINAAADDKPEELDRFLRAARASLDWRIEQTQRKSAKRTKRKKSGGSR
ncbi:hypothetical protein ACRU44_17005 [Mycobacterium colombiense]